MSEILFGGLAVEITSADMVSLLNAFNREKIKLRELFYSNDLVVIGKVSWLDWDKLQKIAAKRGAVVKILRKNGLFWTAYTLMKRPVLVIFALSIFLLSAYVSSRVFFVKVDGNVTIPSNLILESAAQCGIRFGAVRRHVRSEQVKNALLEKMPQLQWAGVNTQGCTAIISVEEKTVTQQETIPKSEICSIVAIRDGIIQDCTVYKGNPLCTVGQAVKAGQTLVSGYLDCGIVTKATKANAEIRALTGREFTFVTPKFAVKKGRAVGQKSNYAIQIGKKLIKLSKDSGNLGVTCAKIYEEKYLRLPAGFTLPIALVKQTSYYYEESTDAQVSADCQQWLSVFAEAYLQKCMIAGEIVSAQTEPVEGQDLFQLRGKYTCTEMIGQIKYEQMIGTGDTNDGEDHKF